MSRSLSPVVGSITTLNIMTCETKILKVYSSLLFKKGKPLNQITQSAMPPLLKHSLTALVTPTTI